jgi:hypothetical protein
MLDRGMVFVAREALGLGIGFGRLRIFVEIEGRQFFGEMGRVLHLHADAHQVFSLIVSVFVDGSFALGPRSSTTNRVLSGHIPD